MYNTCVILSYRRAHARSCVLYHIIYHINSRCNVSVLINGMKRVFDVDSDELIKYTFYSLIRILLFLFAINQIRVMWNNNNNNKRKKKPFRPPPGCAPSRTRVPAVTTRISDVSRRRGDILIQFRPHAVVRVGAKSDG